MADHTAEQTNIEHAVKSAGHETEPKQQSTEQHGGDNNHQSIQPLERKDSLTGLTQHSFAVYALSDTDRGAIPNPCRLSEPCSFTPVNQRVLYESVVTGDQSVNFSFRSAGVREHLHFNPHETTVGIVTCGGLCPGLNDVIRTLVYFCYDVYGVTQVLGFRYGFWGLGEIGRNNVRKLSYADVSNLSGTGGSTLGTSRGPQDPKVMVDTLQQLKVDILFAIGGDGTLKGAHAVHEEIIRRKAGISVIGIPKTIDNDIMFMHRTFGFDTAVSEAVHVLNAAYSEAKSHMFGVGLVKLMGRESGFIAAQAVVASSRVCHICLIPENPIDLETLFGLLARRFERRPYCVIAVAEGFGQSMLDGDCGRDASGNAILADIGTYLRDKISKWLKDNKNRYPESTVKYIDPSYTIRSCTCTAHDASFCSELAQQAVHEGMAGSTDCVIGHWSDNFTCVPLSLATKGRKKVKLEGRLWQAVRQMTVSRKRGNWGPPGEDSLRICFDDKHTQPKSEQNAHDATKAEHPHERELATGPAH